MWQLGLAKALMLGRRVLCPFRGYKLDFSDLCLVGQKN